MSGLKEAAIRDVSDPSKIVIAVMGTTGSGKSSFINAASGAKLPVGDSLRSCTSSVQTSPSFDLEGRSVVLIDTPGFDDAMRTDAELLSMVSSFFAEMYMTGKKLAGIVYLHRISDVRVGNSSRRGFQMFRKLCGEASLKNVTIATTMWSKIPTELEKAREKELMTTEIFFKPVLEKGVKMVRYDNNGESARSILRGMIKNEPLALLIQTEVVDQHKNLTETTAGSGVSDEVTALIARHVREIEAVEEELLEAARKNQPEIRKEAAATMKQLQMELARYMEDERKLRDDSVAQKSRGMQKENKEVQAPRRTVESPIRPPENETREELTAKVKHLQTELKQYKEDARELFEYYVARSLGDNPSPAERQKHTDALKWLEGVQASRRRKGRDCVIM